MPIIVDEVVISVEVANPTSGEAVSGTSRPATAAGPVSQEDRRAIVAECVERVLEILERKAER